MTALSVVATIVVSICVRFPNDLFTVTLLTLEVRASNVSDCACRKLFVVAIVKVDLFQRGQKPCASVHIGKVRRKVVAFCRTDFVCRFCTRIVFGYRTSSVTERTSDRNL